MVTSIFFGDTVSCLCIAAEPNAGIAMTEFDEARGIEAIYVRAFAPN
jgi:hypothetical protein